MQVFFILLKILQSVIINNLGLYLCWIIQQAFWVWKLIFAITFLCLILNDAVKKTTQFG